MRKNFLLAPILSVFFIFLTAIPALCIRYVDSESGMCYVDAPSDIFNSSNAGKYKWLITIDGMHFCSSLLIGCPDKQTFYLHEAIGDSAKNEFRKKNWAILALNWTRDTHKTEKAIEDLRKQLKWCNDRNEPVTILSHSWGTVISYITLSTHPELKVKKLITMGSPLKSNMSTPALFTEGFLRFYKAPLPIKKPGNIESWHNYLISCDFIGGLILNTAGISNSRDVESIEYGGLFKCHRAYFENQDLWKALLEDTMK